MARDLNDITEEELEGLQPHELQALLDHGAIPASMAGEAKEEQQEAPMQAPQGEAPQGDNAAPQPSAEQPQKMVPHGALHEERMRRQQSEQRAAHAEAQLAQLHAQHQQQQQQQAPGLALEDPEAINHLVANHPAVQAMSSKLAEVSQFAAQLQRQQEMQKLQEQYGPKAHEDLADFDGKLPHMAHLPAEAKLLMIEGARAKNPDLQKANDDARIQAAAEKMLAEKLGGAKASNTPVTLSGVVPANKGTSDDPDPANLSDEEWAALPDRQRRKMMGG